MRNTNFLFVLLATLLIFTGCSSDDDDNQQSFEELIVGTWLGVSSSYNGHNTGIPDNNILNFYSTGKAVFIYEGFGNNGEDIYDEGDWFFEGNTLIIDFEDAEDGWYYHLEILELNDTNLKYSTEVDGHVLIENFIRE